MTAPLHDLLDDLAESGRPDARRLGELAWTGGRARRRRRRALTAATAGAAGLVVLLLLGPVLAGTRPPLPGPSFARPSASAVEGHPERIGRQWWVRGLPDRPGPVAALLQTVEEHETHDEPDGWHAVAADGHRWRVPSTASDQFPPALSPDGRLLGGLTADEGPYVVRDLVSGERTVFEEVGGDLESTPAARRRIGVQQPSSWSPDGRRIAVEGGGGVTLLDTVTGTSSVLPRTGPFVGFAGPDRLAWLVDERGDPTAAGDRAEGPVRLVLTDLDGRTVQDVELRPSRGPLPFIGQWSREVSADGAVLAVVDEQQARRFSAADGSELAAPVPVEQVSTCGAAFGVTSATLVVPTLSADGQLVAQRVDASSTRPQTVVAESVAGRCLVWAAAALDGPARRTGPPEEALVLAVAAVGLLAVLRRRLRA